MKRFSVAVLGVAVMLFAGATAQAALTLSWQTMPVLGTSTYYDGNVVVVTDTGLVIIPADDPPGDVTTGASMSVFAVGQTVDAGSGVYYSVEGTEYRWTVTYAGPTRTVIDTDLYPGDSGEGFVMNYLDPVSTLTNADVGAWAYTETWVNTGDPTDFISYSAPFTVAGAVPEPSTIIVWGLLGVVATGFGAWRRKRAG